MFKKKIKMELPHRTRIEVIHSNFFNLLKKNKISQKKYSEDNNVPESTISKWKSCASNMNEEHIIQAANYFNVSVNALYYTEQELKELNVSNDSNYDPIMAQQQIVLETIEDKVDNYKGFLFINLFISLIAMFGVYYLVLEYGEALILLLLIIPLFAIYVYKTVLVYKKTFIINYVDNIYYKIEDTNNKYFVWLIISYVIQIILSFNILCCYLYYGPRSNHDLLVIINFIFNTVYILVLIYSLFTVKKKMKETIYEHEIESYNCSLISSVFCFLFVFSSIPMFFLFYFSHWPLISLLILPILAIVNVSLLAKKHSEYELVIFDQKENIVRKLY